ncbi:MAG: hypothetical protein HY042_05290 [Spirochaetia bacterium]|nr:hypothetical protein [Spirochaetia bacterium]
MPQYNDVTINSGASITANSWNGQTGGIVIFRAKGTVMINGNIDVTQTGYRGGTGLNPFAAQTANQGESHSGLGTASNAQNNGAGGGGSNLNNTTNGSGAPGGYAVTAPDPFQFVWSGSPSGVTGAPGSAISNPALSTLLMGPGGGGLSQGSSQCGGIANGGTGGGVIVVDAYDIEVGSSGSILAVGGKNGICVWHYQLSGAGAGGSVYLRSYIMHLGTNRVNVGGGIHVDDNGVSNTSFPLYPASPGMIRLDYTNKDFSDAGTTVQIPVYTLVPSAAYLPFE